MLNKKIQYSNTFWFNQYLSNYDLIQKYTLKSQYKVPTLYKIKLNLALTDVAFNEADKKANLSAQTLRTAFLFFFALFSRVPYINTRITSSIKDSQKSADNEYFLNISFANQTQIDEFLFFLFIENWTNLLKTDYKMNFNKPYTKEESNNTIQLFSKIPLNVLYNFDIMYDTSSNKKIKEDSSAFLTFFFKNLDSKHIKESIQNLPIFWKNK